MKTFLTMIEQQLKVLNEEDPALNPPPADATGDVPPPPPETETPPSELPDQDAGDDDTAKLKVDYVEMIRKALIMAPKHIDDVDYAKLTKIVDTENLEEMQELVSRIVRNNYPHPDL
tara:strand:+ start:1994 stop:2344 length:351 start_codon:yes stop_codon:yes gene_type:complete